MQRELSSPASMPASWTNVSPWLRSAGAVILGSLLLAVCARVSVPLWFTPVPLSLQPFGVLLLGLVLRPRLAATALIAYLAEGAAGLPVFAPTPVPMGGLVHLLGPTGGYLLAYPMAGALISAHWRRTRRSFSMALVSAALGDMLILVCGAAWLRLEAHAAAPASFATAVLAFLPGDALKVAASAGIAAGWQRFNRHDRRG